MSEQSTKTSNAISVYLSPRANEVLKRYVEYSGFGSVSRTVEELILAYDKMYNTFLSSLSTVTMQQFFSNPQMMVFTFFLLISNLQVSNGSPIEQKLQKEIQQMQSNAGK
jgi:hypothetical protein